MQRIVFPLLLLLLATACIPTEKLKYTIDTEGSKSQFYNDRLEKTIQPYDYLYIKIYSLDVKTAAIFESDNGSGQTNERLLSYEVDDRGYINFPFIGQIYVKDLTIIEAKKKIENSLNQYLTQISVMVRFVGNNITVLGEVRSPGTHTFYDEKINVFQALALAGDADDFGDKTKITLIREKDNNIKYSYLDLSRKDFVGSEYYYLSPNDILIVDPVKAKYRNLRNYSEVYLILTSINTVLLTLPYILRE